MSHYFSWAFPDISTKIAEALFHSDKKLVIVGVIGKSAFPDGNKMVAFNILDCHPMLLDYSTDEGQIQFYYNQEESMLLLHFETTFDWVCMQKMLEQELMRSTDGQFLPFNQRIRNRFARMLLFATQVCHIIVFVELSVTFDASLLTILKSLKIIRDKHVLKFLPKLMKNSTTGTFLGKSARMCSPRFLFLFENYPDGYDISNETISKLEFEVEDNIYKMLRNEFIITNNSGMSLFSIPSNKRFVFYNTDRNLRKDVLDKATNVLDSLLDRASVKDNDDDDLNDLQPFKGFGKPLILCNRELTTVEEDDPTQKRQFMNLLLDHVNEALNSGFDDNSSKFKGKNHFVILPVKAWYDTFKVLHKIFIENPDDPKFEANDVDYKAFLENFDKIMDTDNEFFAICCDIGLQKAFALYNNPALTHYNSAMHKKLVDESIALYAKYARGPQTNFNELKLREMCENCWRNGKQQCEHPSLRGNPCILPKHVPHEASEHSSGVVFVSTCNCGRTQGKREDPYTIRHANFEFYEYMAKNCNLCAKVKKLHFPVFEPSINDYRAAEFEISFPKLTLNGRMDYSKRPISQNSMDINSDNSQVLLPASQHTNLSLETTDGLNKIDNNSDCIISDSDDSVNELVIHVNDWDLQNKEEERERHIYRQPSTTEYLPGMVHTASPMGLLPQFPSWSLVCVGPGSIYSHNTGLSEHFQSGFLSGANFLLPWDVHVRLEHSASWAASYEKNRLRKMGEVFVLKVFVGYEYECPRGHRFIMHSPDKVLRSGSGILRDSGSKVVYNNMPLYFSCPCRSNKSDVAQLMRIHVVTPKAPVNVIVDPKIRTGDRDYVFTMGLPKPQKLTQSAYWILRLPYVYQGDEGPIAPPREIPNAASALSFGCLQAGMFGVSETEVDD